MRKTQTKASHPFKWIIALLVFMLALGVTFSDVHGFNFVKGGTPTGPDGTITSQHAYDMTALTHDVHVTNHHSDDPPAVPEPTTLILMATGLAGIYLARRNK
jgi:hypothetical protein